MGISTQLNFDTAAERDEALAYLQKKYTTKVTKVTQPSWSIEIKPAEAAPVPDVAPAAAPLFQDQFDGPDGLITNEFAYFNPNDARAVKSPDWEMTSGALLRRGNMGWTGVPDKANNSAIFRLTSKRSDFGDVKVAFSFVAEQYSVGADTPAVEWDGAHVFLRYLSQYHLYYASFCRRDGSVVIKKKTPGGPSNDGTYYEISPYVPKAFPMNQLVRVEATVKNVADGVQIALWLNGTKVLEAVDNGTKGGAPITIRGSVGIRGDNLQASFDNFTVTPV